MLRYCAGDLRLTERVYRRMRPHLENHPAIRAVGSEGCPKCHSKKTQKRGVRYTACFQIQRHQCNNCGGWFSGKRKKVA
jgi:transposase-like protein